MIERGKDMRAALARVYPVYQKLQVQRFQTNNASEGDEWDDLNQEYAKYKLKRYGGGVRHKWVGGRGKDGFDKEGQPRPWEPVGTWKSYPYQGTQMLVGTSMLAGAVIGRFSGSPFTYGTGNHDVLFTPTQMIVSVQESGDNPDGRPFDYARFVNEKRPFMIFSDESLDLMRDEVSKYLLGGGE
jgi:hypothetical protein